MFKLLKLLYKTPEDLGTNKPKSLPPGIYYTKDSKGQWLFRHWTGVVWSRGVSSMIEAMNKPEEFAHAKDDGTRIVGWYYPKTKGNN